MNTTGKPVKILVTGDVDGKFNELFTRVNTVNKKNGPFDMLLCTGNFFPATEAEDDNNEACAILLDKLPPVTIPTYILGPTTASQLKYYSNPSGGELKPNITYLGHHGLYTEASGLKIVYLSGAEHKMKNSTKGDHEFDESDVHKLQMQFSNTQNQQGVDILLTSLWPEFIGENAAVQPASKPTHSSALASTLASLLKPRYHFSGSEGLSYERVPYRNHQVLAEATRHVTRFIGLGKVGNPTKTKWLYAFSVTPMIHMEQAELVLNPADVTDNPYIGKLFQKNMTGSMDEKQKPQQFFYDSTYTGEKQQYQRGRGGRGGKRGYDQQRGQGQGYQGPHNKRPHDQQHPPTPCWFCLASPEVEKHLIISIGDSAYLTLAKGGLTSDHVLILPVGHYQSTAECPPEVLDEINKFKKALCAYFQSKSKIVVFYERNYRSPHLQIQCIPLPSEQFGGTSARLNNFKSLCQDYSESESIDLQNVPSNVQIFQLAKPGFPYFFMEIFATITNENQETTTNCTKLFAPIQRGQQFPLQFGRELLACEAILNLQDRIDWRQCKESGEEQGKWTQEFRTGFKSFDFTLL